MSQIYNDLYDTESQLSSDKRSTEELSSCDETSSDFSRGGSQWFLSQASEADYSLSASYSASSVGESCKNYSDELYVCSTPVNTSQASEVYSIYCVSPVPCDAYQTGGFSESNINSGFGNTIMVGEELIDSAHYICDNDLVGAEVDNQK